MPIAGKGPPGWLQPGFQGVVVLDRKLYICSVAEVPLAGGPVVVLGSMPLNAERMDEIGKGLGNVRMLPGFMGLRTNVDDNGDVDVDAGLDGDAQQLRRMPGAKVETFHIGKEKTPKAPKAPEAPAPKKVDGDFINVIGGKVPQAGHFWDVPVLFSAPVTVYGWNSGDEIRSMMVVVSRMTVLYAHLFANSVNTGVVVRLSLIAIAIAFALLELFALLMAAGLSRTITRSVADLYRGTREIDAGNLAHRVRVAKHDQLGALATSFNAMTASVTDLLQQQREKERMINELAIAQEVQTNLFPHSPATVGAFEMHAVCLPARTVGGDYYDFIFSQSNGLCLALGDISGKGISAAMLMASLHSAVRAFLLNTNAQPSPAQMLKLLNRHLYGSTQVERYATLFLACYDGASRKLTYANGGHLPPLVLSLDGTVRPLDCGGPVVGLLSGLEYMEATVQLQAGDLLMAFSDGLTEPENANGEFGAERLLEYVRENQQEPLPVLAANTLKAVQAWIGNNEQPDDMTILLARLH
jgi:sigma-B regulation protein RsbU (phosphoserine phosphatase)